MQKTLFSTLVAGALAAGAIGTSYAVPLTSFDFIGHGGFVMGSASVDPYPDPVYGSPVDVHGVTYYRNLSWGSTTDRSSATVTNFTGSMTVSNTAGTEVGSLTHSNTPIPYYWEPGKNSFPDNLRENDTAHATVKYFIDFIDPDTSAEAYHWVLPDFDLHFWETHNSTDPTCYRTEQGGTDLSVCDDAFSFGPAALSTSFNYLGVNYVASMAGFYDAAGNLTGTFWSAEGGLNTGHVLAQVHVPEPASMALMGLGLAALGVATRRRKQTLKA